MNKWLAFFSSKNDVFPLNTCQFYKKQYFYNPVRVSLAILIQIKKKKKLFLFQLQICGSSSACRKKTRCRRIAPSPPFWDICQWQNFPQNLNTWPNTASKRFFLLPFLQPKKNFQKSMLLHWCCPLKKFFNQNFIYNIFYLGVKIKKRFFQSYFWHILIQKSIEQLKRIFFNGEEDWPLKGWNHTI